MKKKDLWFSDKVRREKIDNDVDGCWWTRMMMSSDREKRRIGLYIENEEETKETSFSLVT